MRRLPEPNCSQGYRSDEEFFPIEVTRILSDEIGEIRTRPWKESIARGFQ
jgi:hypothetical protein